MTKHILLSLAVVGLLHSCAPVYKCGESPEKKVKGSKRLKNVVAERDSLCIELAEEQAENLALNSENNLLKNKLANQVEANQSLQAAYDGLLNQSTTDQAKLMRQLREREEEIAKREKALQEMRAIIERQEEVTRKLNNAIKNALLGFNSDELSIEVKNGKVYVSMSDKLLFKSGSAEVETKGKEALKLLADVMKKNPEIDVLVEGHTDSIPIKTAIYKDNWDLSVGRAASVVRLLTESYQVSPKQVTAAGRGEFYPKATNTTPEGRAKNRRTEIILSPKLDELMDVLK